jgi:hypothetical protein
MKMDGTCSSEMSVNGLHGFEYQMIEFFKNKILYLTNISLQVLLIKIIYFMTGSNWLRIGTSGGFL